MKTLKRNVLKATLILTMALPVGMISKAVAQNASETPKNQKEKSDINSDLAGIKMERQIVASLEKKCKSDKAAGLHMVTIVDRKELAKAKANLERDKAYLAADKADLIRDHNLAIASRRAALHVDRRNLSICRSKLDKNIAAGNEAAASKEAVAVVQYQNELKRDEANLQREKQEKNNDLLAVNREIKAANGQFAPALFAENTVARTEKWLEK